MPILSIFRASSNIGNGKVEAKIFKIDEREIVEKGHEGNAETAISVEESGSGAVLGCPFELSDVHWDLGAIFTLVEFLLCFEFVLVKGSMGGELD